MKKITLKLICQLAFSVYCNATHMIRFKRLCSSLKNSINTSSAIIVCWIFIWLAMYLFVCYYFGVCTSDRPNKI